MAVLIEHPATWLIAGSTGCGKTRFTVKLLNNLHWMCKTPIARILWCHSEIMSRPKDIKHSVKFILGLPSEKDLENPKNEPMFVVLDDLMNEGGSSMKISQMFTRGSHHRNCSILLISQNVFSNSKFFREISLNSKYIVYFKNPRTTLQFKNLIIQMYPEKWRELIKLYKEITQEPYSYIFFDLTPHIEEILRLRVNIFEKAYATVICDCPLPKTLNNHEIRKHETATGQQAYSAYFKVC